MKSTEELISEFGLTKSELKTQESVLLKNNKDVKKAYNFRLLAVFLSFLGGRFLVAALWPSQPWLVHLGFGLLCSWFPSWVMTVYATNPALAHAMQNAEQNAALDS